MKRNTALYRPALFVAALWTVAAPVCFSEPEASSRLGSPASVLAPEAVRNRQAEVKLEYAEWDRLKAGTYSYEGSSKYHWSEIPAGLEGVRWSKHPMHAATLHFKVTQPGLVFMAITKRLGPRGSGSGGDWQREVIDERGLEEEGWRRLPEFDGLKNTEVDMGWLVFYKPCVAGETHAYRTEKYVAPIILMR